MEGFLVLLVCAVFIFSNMAKKKTKKNSDTSVPNRPRQASSVPARGRQYASAAKRSAEGIGNRAKQAASDWRRNLYEADSDRRSEYDQASLDYCDSDVPASGGISFRDLPQGSDELAYLRKWNSRREKMLEQSLESRG